MNYKKEVKSKQNWKGEDVNFDPDSSPEAWEYYKAVYSDFIIEYDFDNLCFFEYVQEGEFKGKYTTKRDTNKFYSRLNALKTEAVSLDKNNLFFEACLRLSGETDFNFNKGKIKIFEKYLKNDEDIEFLTACGKMHHTLLNFSLMQTVGNLQKIKSRGLLLGDKYEWLDRLDSFVYMLDGYFKNDNKIKKQFEENAGNNWKVLQNYLSAFESVYDYCNKTYLIQQDDELILRLIENGSKAIAQEGVAKNYIELAQHFWLSKEKVIKDKM